jgi:hypothetical protein
MDSKPNRLPRNAAFYFSVALAAGLPGSILWAYFTFRNVHAEGAGLLEVAAMLFAVLVGLPMTVMGILAAQRARNLSWRDHTLLFLGANTFSILQGSMYLLTPLVPTLFAAIPFRWWYFCMVVLTLCVYLALAVVLKSVLLLFRPKGP